MKPISKLLTLGAASLLTFSAAHADLLTVSGAGGSGTAALYSDSGTLITTYSSTLADPQGVSLEGNLLAVSEGTSGKIDLLTLSPDLTSVVSSTQISTPDTGGNGQYGIALVGSNVFVSSFSNSRVDEFSLTGASEGSITGLSGNVGLTTDGTNLFIGQISGSILEYSGATLLLESTIETGFPAWNATSSGGNVFGITNSNSGNSTVGVFGTNSNTTLVTGLPNFGDAVAVNGLNFYTAEFGGSGIAEYTLNSSTSTASQDGTGNLITLGGVDDMIYVSAATPEPSSWAMLLGGFGALAAVMRARRTVA